MAYDQARIARSKVVQELDDKLEQREALLATLAEAVARRDELKALADGRYDADTAGVEERLRILDLQLSRHVRSKMTVLRRLLGKTMVRINGTIKVVNKSPEMDWPENVDPVIDALLSSGDPALKAHVHFIPQLDKKAVAQDPKALKLLRPLGVWRGRHLIFSVMSPSENKFKQLGRVRFNERPRPPA